MAIIPWRPFRDIDDFFGGDDDFFSLVPSSQLKEPSLDLYETDKDVVAELSVPGIDPDDIEVSVEDDYLRVKGQTEKREEKKDDKKGYWRREIRRGSFDRTIHLPSTVDENQVDAMYESGMLKIVMPKKEKKSPTKKIEIKSPKNKK